MNIKDDQSNASREEAVALINQAIEDGSDTLELWRVYGLKSIPEEIFNMENLRHFNCLNHLYLDNIEIMLEFKELETFIYSYGPAPRSFLSQLSKLKNLRILHLREFNFNDRQLVEQLTSLEKLEELEIFVFSTPELKKLLGIHYSPKEGKSWSDTENSRFYEEVYAHTTFPMELRKLKNLKFFKIAHSFSHVDKVIEVLVGMPSLRKYYVDGRGYPSLLTSLTQREELKWWRRFNDDLPEDIGNLQNLKKLTLLNVTERIPLNQFPDSFYTLKNLEELHLHYTDNFNYFKEEFQNLTSLHTIHTIGSAIKSIPFSNEQLANLVDISIQSELPDLSYCKKLKKLSYSSNYATRNYDLKASNIESLEQLEYLFLWHCTLSDIDFLSKLVNLRTLHLKDCTGKSLENLTIDDSNDSSITLPKGFYNLQSLKTLEFEYIELDEISPAIKQLTSLQEIWLSSVKGLKKIPKEIFMLPNLVSLSIVHCRDLEEIETGILPSKNLTEIDLYGNTELRIFDEKYIKPR